MTNPVDIVCQIIPPELLEEAARAEERKNAALERLQQLAEEAPPHQHDAFERALMGVIDADKALQEAKKHDRR